MEYNERNVSDEEQIVDEDEHDEENAYEEPEDEEDEDENLWIGIRDEVEERHREKLEDAI